MYNSYIGQALALAENKEINMKSNKQIVIDHLNFLSNEYAERASVDSKSEALQNRIVDAAKKILPIAHQIDDALFIKNSGKLNQSNKLEDAIFSGLSLIGISDEEVQDTMIAIIDLCSAEPKPK